MAGMLKRFCRSAGVLTVVVVILAFLWELDNPSTGYERAVHTFATAMENGDYETLITVYPKIPGKPDFWRAVSGKANYFVKSYDGYTWKFDFTFIANEASPHNDYFTTNNHWIIDVTDFEKGQWKVVSIGPVIYYE